jgi:hypothetical protein
VGGQTLVPSARAASVASTCSSPPALASACWGSGGGRLGSVVSASWVASLGVGSSEAGGSGAGVAMVGFGLRLMSIADLIKQESVAQLHKSRRTGCLLCKKKDIYLQRRLLHDSFLHSQSQWRLNHGTGCWRRSHTSWWCGARHGNGNRSCRRS